MAKTFHVIRGRVVCIIVFIVSIWIKPPCVLLMICINMRMFFTLNSIGCVTKVRSCWHSGEMQPTDVYKANDGIKCMRKIWSNILTARWRNEAHGATKWIKNNLLMIPPWIWFHYKNMLNSTISMSYPDVVIACIEQGVSGSIQSNWGSVGETRY